MASNQQGAWRAPSRQAVEGWLERVDDITASVEEILREDAMEAARRRQEREARRRQTELDAKREKVKMRYDPRYYARFENDEFIDKLLREAEGGGRRAGVRGDESSYTRAERVSLEEALRLKEDAAKAVRASEWARACELYTTAVNLNVVDMELQRTLRNNRALVQLKLKRYLGAVDDASYVLTEEPNNVKALLRRAEALRHLHRPLDALKDAAEALRLEPASQEAGELAHWLQRAKAEQGVCAGFQHRQPEEAKCLASAVNLLVAAVAALRESCAESMGGGLRDGDDERKNEKKLLAQAAESVRDSLGVVQLFHRGATVLFVLLGGLNPLIELVCMTLFSGCLGLVDPVSAGDLERLSARGITFCVAARLLALVLLGSETGVEGLEPDTVASLVRSLTDVLSAALQQKLQGTKESTTLKLTIAVLQLLEGLATRYPIPVHDHCASVLVTAWEVIRKGEPVPQLLFFYCGILEALLRGASVCAAVARDVEELLPHVIEVALSAGPEPLKEVGLSLAVRATCVSEACAKAMGSPQLTRTLSKVLPPFQKGHRTAPLSPRVEEGLYAVVYNVLLRAESRSQYVAQWGAVTDPSSKGDSSFALRTWRALLEQMPANGKSTERLPVHAKMMAVLAKISPHDEVLRDAMLEGEATLWSMLNFALSALESCDVTTSAAMDEEETVETAAAWELVEHSSTCIAGYYSKNLLLREKSLATADRIAVLMRIVRCAGIRHVVALGNAALIASFVPSTSCVHFAAVSGVDVLLEALRSVRELLCTLERDGGKGSTRWIHGRAAQRNLAIALSRCCVVEAQRERLRELKGFETLHAVLEAQPA
ncbi:putative serine/threonine protein phosphatase type 5 [Trypanosoma rangeli]|uniref:Putative serine/threonine protein phosphatase type 5 n=1 Tax=Trypanosoma rangeli TaxID=5698 RepID=A0A3R7K8Y3_TRYRA|nr:putative serine/threonine protein phosphatase type 5 [Trypanosoma rangeli]RNE96045.1 putative serine/threonine protein phosphatase type 5 [Trypanosoma rangeli]|eukprot:RNE96045.1 putative serine/threonine protein phosphatase type 5 [Trypanosoma rangeli]